ncbi:Uncharacterised protein [Klebsiella pneumoniae]|nr:Uncharacterised protein [Klebsiella pneumoniae]SXW81898.1 Uncharacterised protein [Klebsiella pneumoniae]SXW91538.1 Uncharacterised protein [Klebsiella pneumoniae]
MRVSKTKMNVFACISRQKQDRDGLHFIIKLKQKCGYSDFFQTLKIMHLKSLKIWQGLLLYYTILMVMKGMYHLPLLKLL